ncbi:RNA 3'-terminal phosphate cyclase [Podospora australis]|uniref:RNA 3'-terminal phosphate cyclase n=1 Tax=Podospora australis TaxID=1536484 RepID=A0AAN7AP33_9PEZI|nr:RNA 3'-terminal phosphate cyclase [Podospora australis]
MKEQSPIEIDGRTGEGGGQLVRIACALSAVTSIPIRITHVRGRRGGPGGGGLKSQHKTAIEYLAEATNADVSGLSVGSHTLEFKPRLPPSALKDREIKIAADSPAASTLLIFQALLPFFVFAGNDKGEPITVDISGGTNVSFSLSYEYLDQVLLPTLETAFGIVVDRKLKSRGWSMGKASRGTVSFKVHPLKPGETLKFKGEAGELYGGGPDVHEVEEVDVSMAVPQSMHESLTETLVSDLEAHFPGAEVNFKIIEDSGADSRIYVLLVARCGDLRWGRDVLMSTPKKSSSTPKKPQANSRKAASGTDNSLSESISRKLCKELLEEVSNNGVVDEFLQDQLVIFQALAEGVTSFPKSETDTTVSIEEAMSNLGLDDRIRKDKTIEPFGEGSTHSKTARWVTTELLSKVAWYKDGKICNGIGIRMEQAGRSR